MMYNYNDDYQYDSCVSRGICSINPRTSSLQEVLILYLKLTSYYAQKLYEMGVKDNDAKKIIIDTISIMVSNPEFSENDFEALTSEFNTILSRLIKLYEETCNEKNENIDYLKTVLNLDTKIDIIKSIQLGEKEFLEKAKKLNNEIRDLYKILFVLAKSMCINVLELESFDYIDEEAYLTILSILNLFNSDLKDKDGLKRLIIDVAKKDNALLKQLRVKQEERYGTQRENEVSYSTFPAKAILVVGSNIRELEDILEAVKNTDIDVYTHGEMILAIWAMNRKLFT